MLGEDNLALYYLVFCAVGFLGAIQFVAGTYARRELTPLPARAAQFAGVTLVLFSFVWFFSARADLFIPGLAGGEFVACALAGFVGAYLVTRAIVWAAERLMQLRFASAERESESK